MTNTDNLNNARFVYAGDRGRHLTFPLGGIGAGGLSITGGGRLVDWSIRNRPGLQTSNGYTHFAIKAEQNGKVLDARVLNGPYEGDPTGSPGTRRFFDGFGWGANRNTLAGVPHFAEAVMTGRFPVAEIAFADQRFPGSVGLTAFSPFIPTNDRDSSMPVAMFEISVTNNTDGLVDYSLGGTLGNHGCQNGRHSFAATTGVSALTLTSAEEDVPLHQQGDLTIATDADDVDHMDYHFRGQWFDDLNLFWREFSQPGRLPQRHYDKPRTNRNMFDQPEHGTLAARFSLSPGERRTVRFAISWHFPNGSVYWHQDATQGQEVGWRNYYASEWQNSAASVADAFNRWDELRDATFAFRDTLFGSDLPLDIIDAAAGTMAVLRTGTVLRLNNGELWGWEGQFTDGGACEGSCTHVWNYQQAVPYLFPALERTLRETEFRFNQLPDGGLTFRQILPLGSGHFPLNPCADGHFGAIIKTYRDWKISGDTEWLRRYWPNIRSAMEYAWSPDNPDQWDPERTGVLWGRQHHTLDMELFGPNSWLSSMYVAALKAAAAMAEALREEEFASLCTRLGSAGGRYINDQLFENGYFGQQLDLGDKAQIERFAGAAGKVGVISDGFMETYWSDEHGQIKYQFGDGCASDQILGQWHADLAGLEPFLEHDKVEAALTAIFEHNFRPTLTDHFNPCRVYALEDDAGLLIATWPEGTEKPAVPAPYSEEVWTGIEYAVASHLIQRGLTKQGLSIVAGARARHDGSRRNPWNEFECGSYYARSMSAYALVNAWSGFTFDLTKGSIGFAPKSTGRFFWSVGAAWGDVLVTDSEAQLRVIYGALPLQQLLIHGRAFRATQIHQLKAGDTLSFSVDGDHLTPQQEAHNGQT
ncbi:GH116 family glycosyl-hydrolase [Devosia epidermidihirudinis]|uniref:GH116 family glycosyl-hydrolase n=1 Tax=Devosia epidermidihirudinis TaxID=1293439 RepID=UPI0006970941|nr:GH116 family glycosyl-hydrolase [Devosia epidermidihirudinis]